ncbi:MAG: acyltransferase [Ruminococcus sp.]|nr:acyltransferase [Ruminococcus sp.]
MSEKRSKSNKKFMLLSAIGIFMVADHHTFTAFNILGDFMPYNSFFMPMFVFISGYFNKVDGSTNLWTYLVKKIKTLLIPYIGLSLTVFGVQQLINYIKLGNEMDPLPSDYFSFVIKRIVTTGSFGAIVEPMWFVIALFCSLMIYAVLKKLLDKMKLWNSFVMFAVFLGLHLLAIWIARNNDTESIKPFLIPLKCLFFFPFIELGVIYRNSLEQKHSAMSGTGKIALMFFLLLVNAIRTLCLPAAYDIAFDSIDEMAGFTSPYIVTPMISSLVGILFWLTFAELVGKQVCESRFVNFMSCNTFWIMGLHITFYNILNLILMGINNGIHALTDFDTEAFKSTEWYFWGIGSNIKILYVMVGVLGPLGLKWLYDRLMAFIGGRVARLGEGSEQKAKLLNTVTKPVLALLFVGIVAGTVALTRPKISDGESYIPDTSAETDIGADSEPDTEEPSADPEDDGRESTPDAGQESYPDGGQESSPDNGGQESEAAIPADASPVYAYLDLAYEHDGEAADYLTNACAVNGNGSFTFTVSRSDDAEVPLAIDGLSYMGIRIMDDDTSDLDIRSAEIPEVKVKCGGDELRAEISGFAPYEDGVIMVFLDCFDPSGTETYDFSGKDEIEVTFTVSSAKLK